MPRTAGAAVTPQSLHLPKVCLHSCDSFTQTANVQTVTQKSKSSTFHPFQYFPVPKYNSLRAQTPQSEAQGRQLPLSPPKWNFTTKAQLTQGHHLCDQCSPEHTSAFKPTPNTAHPAQTSDDTELKHSPVHSRPKNRSEDIFSLLILLNWYLHCYFWILVILPPPCEKPKINAFIKATAHAPGHRTLAFPKTLSWVTDRVIFLD